MINQFKEGDEIGIKLVYGDPEAVKPNKPIKKKLTKHEADGKDKKPEGN